MPYRLTVEDKEFKGTTTAEGEIEVGISGRDKQGKLYLNDGEEVFDVAIGRLDPIDQIIVIMRVYREEPFAVIGQEVGMKADTARVRFARAMRRLSGKLRALENGDTGTFLA